MADFLGTYYSVSQDAEELSCQPTSIDMQRALLDQPVSIVDMSEIDCPARGARSRLRLLDALDSRDGEKDLNLSLSEEVAAERTRTRTKMKAEEDDAFEECLSTLSLFDNSMESNSLATIPLSGLGGKVAEPGKQMPTSPVSSGTQSSTWNEHSTVAAVNDVDTAERNVAKHEHGDKRDRTLLTKNKLARLFARRQDQDARP